MSSQIAKPGAPSETVRPAGARADAAASGTAELPEPRHRGKTFISDEVVSVIARLAAEQVEGIHNIGHSNFRSMFARFGRHHGVESEVGLKEAAVDIDVSVVFGYPIRELAQELREIVIDSVERMTGRRVIEVNVNVNEVWVPGQEQRTRRQLE